MAVFSLENIKTAKHNLLPENAKPIKNFIKDKGVSGSLLTEESGIYIFWWHGDIDSFRKTVINSTFLVKGKKSHQSQIKICFSQEWLDCATHNGKVCLYVGKTTSIRDRVSKHLKLGSTNIWKGKPKNSGIKPNTVSQMRIGLETVYDRNMLEEIKENVSLSYHPMNKYAEAINRFYVEDYFIAHYFPLFNIDVER